MGRPPAKKRGADTPARLLDAALAVFAREGLAGYTVHAVIAESGVSLGSLYHHFGSMDGLSAALYSRCMGALLDAIGDALEGASGPRAVITTIVRAYLRFTAREPVAASFIHSAPAAAFLPAHAASIAAAKAPRFARIADAIRPHLASGAIAPLPEPLLEILVIGPAAETARRFLSGTPGITLEAAEKALPERVWRAVRAT